MKNVLGLVLVGILMSFDIAWANENTTQNSGSKASGDYTGCRFSVSGDSGI